MSAMATLALFGWPVVVLAMFTLLPARRAVIAAFVLGWLLLPMAGYSIAGFPDYTKTSATCLAALLGVMMFDAGALARLRPHWLDLPVLVWCVCPLPSALSCGLGPYAGLSAVVQQMILWGVPYLLGRAYFADAVGRRELLLGLLLGGLLYVPLCLIEVIKGPYLHYEVYGFMQHTSLQARRFDGWRPMVFLQHGLATGFWMTAAGLAGLWLWAGGTVRTIRGWPVLWLSLLVLATAVACKSTGAWALLALGVAVLAVARTRASRVVLTALLLAIPLYAAARVTGTITQDDVSRLAGMVFPPERISSLEARLGQEDVIAAHALNRPFFGWGPWGAFREGEGSVKATDSLWIITFGKYGAVGLAGMMATLLLPALTTVWLLPRREWMIPATAPAIAGGLLLIIYVIDCMSNAMVNPLFAVLASGLGVASVGRASVAAHRHALAASGMGSISPTRGVDPTSEPMGVPARGRL